jgi:hypothetical protein
VKFHRRFAVLSVLLGIALSVVVAQNVPNPSAKTKYPEPRFPSYLKQPKSVDDLMPNARAFVLIKQGNQGYGMGNFKSGDTLLIVPDATAEPLPLGAVQRALEERGIKVIVRTEAEMVGLTSADADEYRRLTVIPSAKQGYLEARNYWFDETPRVWAHPDVAKDWLKKRRPDVYDALYPKDQEITSAFAAKAAKMRSPSVGNAIREYLEQHPDVIAFYWGKPGAGFSGPRALGAQGEKLKGPTTFANFWVLASQIPTFPSEVFHMIEKKTVERFTMDIDKVHVTDAEGTDVSWDVTPELAKRWLGSFYEPDHLLVYPDTATGKHGGNIDRFPVPNKEWTPREPIALINGVIAGTNGSGGFYPRMEITYKDGYMTGVKGGGMYGDILREFMQYPHINDLKYPYYDRPGYWHLWELALGTQPKNFRNPSDFYGGGHTGIYCLTFERYRAGVFHWGFGNEIPDEEGSVGQPVRWLKFGADNNVPTGHDFHIHNYFITYQVHRKSGEWVTIVDKGHLVALDDADVRAVASKYGDPDRLLTEDWIPEVPGINVPGSYEDYSRDPWKYTEPQMQKILNGTYEHFYPPVKDRK